MTAEIAVLNKHAVALASDSAVTISHSDGDKVFNSVNKLFALSKYAPVGMMIFGDADFMDIPWEPLIKLYRSQLRKRRFGSIDSYAADFSSFLERHRLFTDAAREANAFERRVGQFFMLLRSRIDDAVRIYPQNAPISGAVVRAAVDAVIDNENEHLTYHPTLPRFQKSYVIKRKKMIERVRGLIFQHLPLTSTQRRRLFELLERQFASDYMPNTSGVVVAGFGEDEIYPALAGMELDGIYGGRLRYRVSRRLAISDTVTSGLLPFAQQEMVVTFMNGIDPQLQNALDSSLETLLSAVPSDTIAKRLGLSTKQSRELKRILASVGEVTIDMFRQKARDYQQQVHVAPVTAALSHLPKDELAELAESLVHLTSLKRRVALETETVGGPIDVAVISKGDGFIWLKRKHYFRPELNPYFFSTYYQKDAHDE